MVMAKFRRVYGNRPFVYKDFKISQLGAETIIDSRTFRIYLRYTETMDYDVITIDEIVFGDELHNMGVPFDVTVLKNIKVRSMDVYYKFKSNKRADQKVLKSFLTDLDFGFVEDYKISEYDIINIETFVKDNILGSYQINQISDWVRI